MILVAAATPWEARPLAAALRLSAAPGGAGLYSGVVAGRRIVLAEVGVGPERAAESLGRIDARDARLALSAGFAGALAPGLRPGDIVADMRGAPAGWGEQARRIASRMGAALRLGAVVSADHVCTPEEKRALGAAQGPLADDGPLAIDMETETVRQWARARGAAFVSARVVLDAADERVPAAAPESAAPAALARYVLRNYRDAAVLARLAVRRGPAMRRLCSFLNTWISEVRPDGNDA